MNFDELKDKHFNIWAHDDSQSCDDEHVKVSIEYAISVLEGMKDHCHYFMDRLQIVHEIDKLKEKIK